MSKKETLSEFIDRIRIAREREGVRADYRAFKMKELVAKSEEIMKRAREKKRDRRR